MSNLSLAKTLQDACTAMIEREFACLIIPGLRDAIRVDHDKKQAVMALEKFVQFVRELVEPPMIVELSGHNQMNNLFDQMGFIKSEVTMFVHPVYDFFVYLVPIDCDNDTWKVDATKTSLRHFFRKFHTHIEQQIYDRLVVEAYSNEL